MDCEKEVGKMKNDRIEKLKSMMRNPVILLAVIVIVVLLVVLIVLSIAEINKPEDTYYQYSEYDPASETEIWFGAPTGAGPNNDKVVFAGVYEGLISKGVTPEQYVVFLDAFNKFSETSELDFYRVSYLKDSFELKGSYVFTFDVVLNVDETLLKVVIDSSAGWKNIEGMFVTISNENGEELFRLTVTEDNVCDYRTPCKNVDDGT